MSVEISNYTGLWLEVKADDPLEAQQLLDEQAQRAIDPIVGLRRDCAKRREAGTPTREVVLVVNGEEEELTFDEFEARYCK